MPLPALLVKQQGGQREAPREGMLTITELSADEAAAAGDEAGMTKQDGDRRGRGEQHEEDDPAPREAGCGGGWRAAEDMGWGRTALLQLLSKSEEA